MLGLALAFFSCENRTLQNGYLNIVGPEDKTYEIYRIASSNPLALPDHSKVHFVSEQAGFFNQPLSLKPGQYLVLADCSSTTVLIYPGQTENLSAHRVYFEPPHKPSAQDEFTIQCDRSGKTNSRQTIRGRFELNILSGKREILVGMIPLEIDVNDHVTVSSSGPQSFQLSALKISDAGSLSTEQLYFVSPIDERISATQSQHFGHWMFLLPGEYLVEVNGTSLNLKLAAGESQIIDPAVLRVSSSDAVNLEEAAQVLGKPPYVEINDGHYLEFNESYAVLPSPARIRFSDSARTLEQPLMAGERVEINARSVTVRLDCSPWDWTCLGDKEVMLYFEDQPYPFVESVTDIPVLYSESDETILVGIEGSRDIRYQLPKQKRDFELLVGYVLLVPQPTFKPGQITDLVRVETLGQPYSGHSLDLDLGSPTKMPLFEGSYRLAQYVSMTNTEGERRRTLRNFKVKTGEPIVIEFPVYVSEKAFKNLPKEVAQKEAPDEESVKILTQPSGYFKML